MKPILRQLPGLLLMCAGLGLTTLALAMLWLAPEVFVARARVAVTPPSQQPSNVAARGPGWTPTEVELIQAKRVLFQVITNLDLQRKWAEQMKAEDPLPMDKAYQLLKKQLTVLQPRNGALIEIRVQSYSPIEASTLANRIADAYRDTREDGTVVQVVESALPPPKGRRSGSSNALALFLAGVAVLGVGYWVQRSAGLLGPAPAK
jgi:uncharacterized protein involved in exopolysaccharide biosynthesis